MTTIVPQMAKLSVKDLLETRQRLEADIQKLCEDFTALTGVGVHSIEMDKGTWYTININGTTSHTSAGSISVELAL